MPFIPRKNILIKIICKYNPSDFKFMSNTCSISASYELTSIECTAKYMNIATLLTSVAVHLG